MYDAGEMSIPVFAAWPLGISLLLDASISAIPIPFLHSEAHLSLALGNIVQVELLCLVLAAVSAMRLPKDKTTATFIYIYKGNRKGSKNNDALRYGKLTSADPFRGVYIVMFFSFSVLHVSSFVLQSKLNRIKL